MVFGEPEQWLALLIESLLVAGRGEHQRSRELSAPGIRGRGTFRAARSTARRSSGSPMPTRGSVRCSRRSSTGATTGSRSRAWPKSRSKPPADLRDLVWMPAHLQFANGGEVGRADSDALPRVRGERRRRRRAGAQDDLARARPDSYRRSGPADIRHRRRRTAADGSSLHCHRPGERRRAGRRRLTRGWDARLRIGCSRRCWTG